jgi:hypothetical protein
MDGTVDMAKMKINKADTAGIRFALYLLGRMVDG